MKGRRLKVAKMVGAAATLLATCAAVLSACATFVPIINEPIDEGVNLEVFNGDAQPLQGILIIFSDESKKFTNHYGSLHISPRRRGEWVSVRAPGTFQELNRFKVPGGSERRKSIVLDLTAQVSPCSRSAKPEARSK